MKVDQVVQITSKRDFKALIKMGGYFFHRVHNNKRYVKPAITASIDILRRWGYK